MPKRTSLDQPDSGTVTAEFAIALPVVIALAVFGLLQVRVQFEGVELAQDLAYATRALARQEPETQVLRWFESRHPRAHIKKSISDGVLCLESGPSPTAKHCTWVGDH